MSFYKYNRPKSEAVNSASGSGGKINGDLSSVSIWGQPFDYTNDITGDFITQGKVSIGNAENSFEWNEEDEALSYSGNLETTGSITVNEIYLSNGTHKVKLSLDSNGFLVIDGNLYSTGSITAFTPKND